MGYFIQAKVWNAAPPSTMTRSQRIKVFGVEMTLQENEYISNIPEDAN